MSTEAVAPACGHDESAPHGAAMCEHLQRCQRPRLCCVKWYCGEGLEVELLCVPCADARQRGVVVEVARVCETCFLNIVEDLAELIGARGQAGAITREAPFDPTLLRTPLPQELGRIVDLAPLESAEDPLWILLTEDGALVRFDADSLEHERLAACTVAEEPEHEPWVGHALRRHLHLSADGHFAAVVNDFGHHGQVIDLRTGEVTLTLHGGEDDAETVPFSLAFATAPDGRAVLVHRTDWNRLDISDPETGELLTERQLAEPADETARPERELDYFHGALAVSPGSVHLVDDGWVWHPVGMPTAWSLERWLGGNVWESEDGPSRRELCLRAYYWNGPMIWIDDTRVAIGGLGEDDDEMVAGARIFDVTAAVAPVIWDAPADNASEPLAFGGPAGRFFSDGGWLFSADASGLSRWDVATGERTGELPGFEPSHHHRGSGELVQLVDGVMVRWAVER